jgi:hypothetical protein
MQIVLVQGISFHDKSLRSHLSSGQDAVDRPILQMPKVLEFSKKWEHILTTHSHTK